jgi:hypothetical protein
MKPTRIPILLGTLISATLLQAQTPTIVSATKVGNSDKVRVTFDTPVTPAGTTNLLADDFSGESIDTNKWSINSTPWLAGGTLDNDNTSVTQTNGQVEFDVYAASDWGGVSLKTVSSFSASLSQPLVFEITREFFDQNANYAFPGVWITDDTRTKFVYFGEDFGTDPGGWQYNRKIGDPDFDNTDPEEGIWNTALVNDDDIGDFFNNGEDHRIKAVVDGTTVRLYLDGFFASEVSFPLTSGIFFEFGAYCSAPTDEDENEVESAFSDAKVARLNAVSLTNFSINNGATVTGVSITSDPRVLELTTTGVTADSPYTLTISGVQSSDGTPIAPNSTIAIQTTATKNAAYAAAVLADHPVAYFQMDQINGTTVPNLGSAATPGTFKALGGPDDRSQLTPGAGLPLLPGFDADNTAAVFDGIKCYIDTGVPYFRSPLPAFTIELWVKPALLNDEGLGLVGNDDASSPIEFGFIDPGFGDPGTVQCSTADAGEVEAPYAFPYNEWHQIVAVGNGTNLLLYLDGALASTDGEAAADYGDDGAVPTYIGLGVFDALDAGSGGWQGAMDEIAIYTNALSAERIQAHYAVAYAEALHPTVTITNPVENAAIAAGTTVTIMVQTSAAAGRTLSRVQFFDRGNLLGESTASPFSFDIPSIEAGRHVLTAKAFDDLGVSTLSAPVKFTIGNLPLLVFVVPNATDLSDSDEAVQENLIRLGFDVALVSARALTAEDVSEAVLVVASDTDNDSANSLLAELPVPIVTWDEGQQPTFLFVEDAIETDWNDEDNANILIVDASHPIVVAAGLSAGAQLIQDPDAWGVEEHWAPWGVPSSGATIIATTVNVVDSANPVPGSSHPAQLYTYTNGAALIDDSPAPERRVFFPLDNRWNDDGWQLLNTNGVALFNAAVNWAALPHFRPPTVSGTNLNLSWIGGLGGTLQSADTLGGTWTDIPGATSPYPVPIAGSGKFFRIKR